MEETWPSNQSTDSVEAKSPDEDGSVSIMAKNPVCMTERGERICAEIGSLKTGRSRSINVQCILEMFVQRVKKAIREALDLLIESNE